MSNDAPPPPPPATPPGYGTPAPVAGPLSASDDRLWGSLAHFGNILGFLPALLIYLILKDRGPIVRRQAKEALNWIIGATAVFVVLQILSAILTGLYIVAPSGIDTVFNLLRLLVTLAIWALIILNLVFSIVAGVKVNQTGEYRYPFALRLIK